MKMSTFIWLLIPEKCLNLVIINNLLKGIVGLRSYKVFRLLNSLSVEEFKEFEHFLKFKLNPGNRLLSLFSFIKKYYPEFRKDAFSHKCVFNHLYGSEEYNDKKMRDCYSELVNIIEEYMVNREITDNVISGNLMLLRQLKKRKLHDDVNKYLHFVLKENKIELPEDEYAYLHKYLILNELDREFDEESKTGVSKKYFDQYIIKSNNLIYFTIIGMLKAYIKLFMSNSLMKFDYNFKFMDVILNHIKAEIDSYKHVKLIGIYYEILSIMKSEQTPVNYYLLRNLLDDNKEIIEPLFWRELYIELFNYCKNLQHKNVKPFASETFELMNKMLKDGLFYDENKIMPEQNYRTLIAVGLRLGKMDWTKEFINSYKDYLIPEIKEDSFNYNMAAFCYMRAKNVQQKDKQALYDTALSHLGKVTTDELYYYSGVRILYLKIYIETDELNYADSIIDNFKHYLKKNKLISEDLYNDSINFVASCEKIIKLKSGNSRLKKDKVKDLINSYDLVNSRKWLLSKIDET